MQLLERRTYDAMDLLQRHPPRWADPHKQAIFERVRASPAPWEGELSYARWLATPAQGPMGDAGRVEFREGFFDYAPGQPAARDEWYLNFADPDLFYAYGTRLLAQDELQVLEHPILGDLREALVAAGAEAMTVDSQRRPTPVTIMNVQRRVHFETRPDAAAGRPGGLYGNRFAAATLDAVLAATNVLEPPTVSNILAMAAPAGGWGPYRRHEIEFILATATTGFRAARHESEAVHGPGCSVVVHTGFWGCGAFGGNRQVMTILQAFAAALAGVDLVFHASDAAGVAEAQAALQLSKSWHSSPAAADDIVAALLRQGFLWGRSDGN